MRTPKDTLSHQYIDQLRPETRVAVFGNVGSMIVLRVGERDAEILAKELGSTYAPSSLTGLGNFQVCAKLLVRGTNSPTFFGTTLPSFEEGYGKRDTIIRRSREKYGTKTSIAEERIKRWLGNWGPYRLQLALFTATESQGAYSKVKKHNIVIDLDEVK